MMLYVFILSLLIGLVSAATDLGFNQGTQTSLNVAYTADNCLGSQDMNSVDIDISNCPVLPDYPEDAFVDGTSQRTGLGLWELDTTKAGKSYVYKGLSKMKSDHGVDDRNIECWAKGYYRLRQILQNPPPEYMKLRKAGFQGRFFQYQVDKRHGDTGYTQGKLTAYKNHLIKWVTVVDSNGKCVQPTYKTFQAFSKAQIIRRGI